LQTAQSVKRIPEFIVMFCFGKLGRLRGWFETTLQQNDQQSRCRNHIVFWVEWYLLKWL